MAVIKLALQDWGGQPFTRLVPGTIVKGAIGVHYDIFHDGMWQLTHIPTGYFLVGRIASRQNALQLAKRIIDLAGDHDLADVPASEDRRKHPRWFQQINKQVKAEISLYREAANG